ncbi:MAG: DNA-methyltransferase [Candidatus Hodarchaeales archaeon]|jgi:site-specific DNA-methyltransferase (adenine-specific)
MTEKVIKQNKVDKGIKNHQCSSFITELAKKISWDKNNKFTFLPTGILYSGDCNDLLTQIPSESIDIVFADPPYNIGKANWDEFQSEEEYLRWCKSWISECNRILKLSGSMFIMGYSEILAKVLTHLSSFFPHVRWLVWHYRNKPMLGKNDWVRSHESILHVRKSTKFIFNSNAIREPYNVHTKKYPERSQGKSSQYQGAKTETQWWSPNTKGAKPRDVIDIPALNNSMKEKTKHPTQKPEALLRKLLMGTAPKNGLILDPFAGSGTSAIVAEQMELSWVACELKIEYIEIIKKRINEFRLNPRPLNDYIKIDIKQAKNRAKVRGELFEN